VFIELPEVGWLVLLLLCHYLPCVFLLKAEWLVAKAKLAIFLLTCVSKVMFLGFCGQSISSCTVLNYNRKDVILIM